MRFARRYSRGGSAERAQQRGPTAAVEPSDVKQWIPVAGRGVREKKTRKAGKGSPSVSPFERPLPSLPPRDASPVSIGKDGYQNDDQDDQKPGRHGAFPWEAGRLYAEWMALGGVELSRGHILASGLGAKGSAG